MKERRVMALDLGSKRIGVALSDPTQFLASPLTTIQAQPRERALEQLARLVAEHDVECLVVGFPLTLAGEIGPQARAVQAFVELLHARLHLPIKLVDERLTSAEAERMLIEAGLKPEKRKQQIDQVAAMLILQDFLDSRRNRLHEPQ
jgi:putative Holliday junction resolvase